MASDSIATAARALREKMELDGGRAGQGELSIPPAAVSPPSGAPRDVAAVRRALGQPLRNGGIAETDGAGEPQSPPARPPAKPFSADAAASIPRPHTRLDPPPHADLVPVAADVPVRTRPAWRHLSVVAAILVVGACAALMTVEAVAPPPGPPPALLAELAEPAAPDAASAPVLRAPGPEAAPEQRAVPGLGADDVGSDAMRRPDASGLARQSVHRVGWSLPVALVSEAAPVVRVSAAPVAHAEPERPVGEPDPETTRPAVLPDRTPPMHLAPHAPDFRPAAGSILVLPGRVGNDAPVVRRVPAADKAVLEVAVAPGFVVSPAANLPAARLPAVDPEEAAELATVLPRARPEGMRQLRPRAEAATVAAVRELATGVQDPPPPELAGPRLVVHYSAANGSAAARRAASDLRAAGYGRVELRGVSFGISRSNIRYFHRADRSVADRSAQILGAAGYAADTRDFTFYQPLPTPGTVEVWINR
jgi:hypothetical protein